MSTRKGAIAVAAAAIALGGAAAIGVGVGGRSASASHGAKRPTTAAVARGNLVDYVDAPGELAYGEPVPLRYAAPTTADAGSGSANGGAGVADAGSGPADSASPGSSAGTPEANTAPAEDDQHVVTWLPAVGTTVRRGGVLFRVDDKPVVLLLGSLPVYRTMRAGMNGPDIQQLETNLAALGYRGFTIDESFTDSTTRAVRDWQRSSGMPVTGMIAPGQIVYAGRPIRVAKAAVRVGDPAAGTILDYTGTALEVTVSLPVDQRQYAGAGTKLTVTLPNGKAIAGTVDRVSGPAQSADLPGGGPTVSVAVAVADQAALGRSPRGTVTVRFAAAEREDVLSVPVAALVALAEGGYGVEVVAGSATRYVAVTTGMFADGRVEITSGDLSPGMLVVVPE